MKRTLVASLLGLAATIATTYGQGVIAFDSYSISAPQIRYGSNNIPATATAGETIGSTFDVQLLYALGTTTDAGALVPVPNSTGPVAPLGVVVQDGDPIGGWYTVGVVTLPNWTSGAVTFAVRAWQTSGPLGGADYASSLLSGMSGLWTEPDGVVVTPANPVNFFTAGPPGFSVQIIPEPGTFALAGLGAAALLIFRRRK